MSRDFYKVAIVSQSGKGKTYAARNMNPLTTGFINVENKPLPFKNTFKHHKRCTSYQEAIDTLIEYAKNDEVKQIVFDSFSAYVDLLLLECRKSKKGFDIWNMYNEEIGKLLNLIKRIPKEIYMIAHYEILGVETALEKRIKVKGKEWEGLIEKEFSVVLFADRKVNEQKKVEAWFDLNLENTSSKCPPEIFGEDVTRIPNDYNFIQQKIEEFVA